jgi:hypothetical protein
MLSVSLHCSWAKDSASRIHGKFPPLFSPPEPSVFSGVLLLGQGICMTGHRRILGLALAESGIWRWERILSRYLNRSKRYFCFRQHALIVHIDYMEAITGFQGGQKMIFSVCSGWLVGMLRARLQLEQWLLRSKEGKEFGAVNFTSRL